MKRVVVAGFALLLLLGGTAWWRPPARGPSASPTLIHVVQIQQIAPEILLAGRLEWAVAQVLHAPADGTLRALRQRHLDAVSPGDVLAEIASPLLEEELGRARIALLSADLRRQEFEGQANGAEILQQRSALAEVDAQIAQARRRAATVQELVAAGIAPRQELMELQARVEELRVRRMFVSDILQETERRRSPEARRLVDDQLTHARSSLARVERALAELVLRSDVAGRVVLVGSQSGGAEAPRQVGESVRRGERIAVIADSERLEVVARADEVDAVRLEPGAGVVLSFAVAGLREVAGRVRDFRRLPRPPSGTATAMEEYVVNIEVTGRLEGLLPGATALARVATAGRTTMLVPLRFVQIGTAGRGEVRLMDPSTGEHTLRPVLVGPMVGESVEVLGGLEAGARLLEIR